MKRTVSHYNDLAVAFGAAIRRRRLELSLDYEQVSEVSGLKVNYLKSIEVGTFCPAGRNARTLSMALNWNPHVLVLVINIVSELGENPSKKYSDSVLSFWMEEVKEFKFLGNKNFQGLGDILNKGIQFKNTEIQIGKFLSAYPNAKELLRELAKSL